MEHLKNICSNEFNLNLKKKKVQINVCDEAAWAGVNGKRNIENLFPSSCLFVPSSSPLSSVFSLLSLLSPWMGASLRLDPLPESE